MERITMCCGTVAAGDHSAIRLRLEDRTLVFYHSTGILADNDSMPLTPETRSELDLHILAMCKAYTVMQLRGMEMDNGIFEKRGYCPQKCVYTLTCKKKGQTVSVNPRKSVSLGHTNSKNRLK